MERAISTITVLPENKEETKRYISSVKEEILSGYENPLFILKQLKIFESIIKELLKDEDIRDCFMNEAMKEPQKTFFYKNAEFQVKNLPAKYDYSVCNDSDYDQLCKKIEFLLEEKKGKEKGLQKLKEPYINQETGEIINPPVKRQSEIISVKIK